MSRKLKILFLCTANSCRSQMAEGLANALRGSAIEAYSAGTAPSEINPKAVSVMKEIGIDISGNRSKSVDEMLTSNFDFVITVCDDAHEHCPYWSGRGKVLHKGFDDPPKLAKDCENETDELNIYRRVRDQVKEFVLTFPSYLESIK